MKLKLEVTPTGTELRDENGTFVASLEAGYQQTRMVQGNHIVRCVNNHDVLVESLNELIEVCEEDADISELGGKFLEDLIIKYKAILKKVTQ